MHNATHDFTEQDRIALEWALRKAARREIVMAGRKTCRMMVKDKLFIVACFALVAAVVGVSAIIIFI